MRTLLIDNYDSFSYNLFHILAEITGHAPIMLRNDEPQWENLGFDNVVIGPGPGRPDRPRDFGICSEIIRRMRCPVLGVCLGHQGIACAFGAHLGHAPEPVHGRLSAISHNGSELFHGIPQGFLGVRYHSLAVRRPLPDPLVETAWSEDGVLMGLRHRERPLWGVQFHPESVAAQFGRKLLENFLRLSAVPPRPVAASRRPAPRRTSRRRWRWRVLDALPDPESVFETLYARLPAAFWLDSSRADPGLARFSFMGTGDVSHRLELVPEAPDLPFPFDFVGGWVGYLGYPGKRSAFPDTGLIRAERFLAFDHEDRKLYLVAAGGGGAEPWLDATLRRIERAGAQACPPLARPRSVRFLRSREDYLRDIEECLRLIRDGESYQVCLTNKLILEADPDPWHFYRALRRANPAPFAAYLRFPGFAVACSSPERFLRVATDGWVDSQPIKGTAPRSTGAARLAASVKDRAENLMIVDLLRNDLGRVCLPGTVHVPKLMEVATFETLHHLVSTIRGRLRPGCTAIDCVHAAFPGGSMTGAPKPRTMEILDRLETQARGIYSGALGYFSLNGSADLNIVIRTAVLASGRVEIGAGGGIVALSDPIAEYDEMVLKAASVAGVLGTGFPHPIHPGAGAGLLRR